MTHENPEKLDELTPHQLIAEIRQIAAQYAAEVPGTRRNWPESIRARALALGRLGVPKRRIADLTGIPAATVFLWCRALPRSTKRRSGKFIELGTDANPTVRIQEVSPTVGVNSVRTQLAPVTPVAPNFAGLVLRAPDGFSFEGLPSVDECVRLYRVLLR